MIFFEKSYPRGHMVHSPYLQKHKTNKKNFYRNIYVFFVCFVLWTKQQQQQLQFVQYDGLPQHPNPNFQMLEDVIITWVFQSMQEEEDKREELYEQQ